MVNFNMTINEIDPYDAETAIALGSYRDGGSDIGNALLSGLATNQYNPAARAVRSSGTGTGGHYGFSGSFSTNGRSSGGGGGGHYGFSGNFDGGHGGFSGGF